MVVMDTYRNVVVMPVVIGADVFDRLPRHSQAIHYCYYYCGSIIRSTIRGRWQRTTTTTDRTEQDQNRDHREQRTHGQMFLVATVGSLLAMVSRFIPLLLLLVAYGHCRVTTTIRFGRERDRLSKPAVIPLKDETFSSAASVTRTLDVVVFLRAPGSGSRHMSVLCYSGLVDDGGGADTGKGHNDSTEGNEPWAIEATATATNEQGKAAPPSLRPQPQPPLASFVGVSCVQARTTKQRRRKQPFERRNKLLTRWQGQMAIIVGSSLTENTSVHHAASASLAMTSALVALMLTVGSVVAATVALLPPPLREVPPSSAASAAAAAAELDHNPKTQLDLG
ncbi:unnamed protein product [Soboliphyme baturini]|uniref:Membrane-associated protein n=1 Tax=Soboliphyme baturini TaxID=241478 RepID=A0A183ICF8_9BILA|nr:unnamed protein product [Soboliphyme baturini]